MDLSTIKLPPTGCKECGTILTWILAAQYNYECPTCRLPSCFICGCSDTKPCTKVVSNKDATNSQEYQCSWIKHGPCSFCLTKITEELYSAAAAAAAAVASIQTEQTIGRAQYIDEATWAKTQHITIDQAKKELEAGVQNGELQKMFLYEGSDSPITFLVPEDMLGQSVSLSELGYSGEEENQQILISPLRSRPVYVQTVQTINTINQDST